MKVNQDRRTKAGTLSLALDRYQNSPKYHLHEEETGPAFQEIKKYQRKVNTSQQKREKSKSKVKDQSGKKNHNQDDPQQQDQLFAMCNKLTSKIETLKKEKYEFVISKFEEDQRRKLAKQFEVQQHKIKQKYKILKKQLSDTNNLEKSKITKSLEDIKKFRQTYNSMMQDLQQKKQGIQQQYKQSLGILKEYKEKMESEWKRGSNQQLLKLGFKNNQK